MSRYAQWGLWTFLLVGLAGCVPPSSPRLTVNVIGDKFSKDITLDGLPMIDPNNGDGLYWMLRSLVDPQNHIATHQIYVAWTYAGHSSGRYSAADDTAQSLPVTIILKESCPFDKCDRTDTFGIKVDEAELRARANSGFEVKISAQDGTSGIISITPRMIGAQLEAENRALGGQPNVALALSPGVTGVPNKGAAPATASRAASDHANGQASAWYCAYGFAIRCWRHGDTGRPQYTGTRGWFRSRRYGAGL